MITDIWGECVPPTVIRGICAVLGFWPFEYSCRGAIVFVFARQRLR